MPSRGLASPARFRPRSCSASMTVLQNVLVGFPARPTAVSSTARSSPRGCGARRRSASTAALELLDFVGYQRRSACARQFAAVRPPAAGRDRPGAGDGPDPDRDGRAGGRPQPEGGGRPRRADHAHQRSRHRDPAGRAPHGPRHGDLRAASPCWITARSWRRAPPAEIQANPRVDRGLSRRRRI